MKNIRKSSLMLIILFAAITFIIIDKTSEEAIEIVTSEKLTQSYNYNANNILENVIKEDNLTILPYVLKSSNDELKKSDVKEQFKQAGETILNLDSLGDKLATGDKIQTTSMTYTILIYGDVDSNGKVNEDDAEKVLKYYVYEDKYPLSDICKLAANVKNDDNVIDAFDAERILKFKYHGGAKFKITSIDPIVDVPKKQIIKKKEITKIITKLEKQSNYYRYNNYEVSIKSGNKEKTILASHVSWDIKKDNGLFDRNIVNISLKEIKKDGTLVYNFMAKETGIYTLTPTIPGVTGNAVSIGVKEDTSVNCIEYVGTFGNIENMKVYLKDGISHIPVKFYHVYYGENNKILEKVEIEDGVPAKDIALTNPDKTAAQVILSDKNKQKVSNTSSKLVKYISVKGLKDKDEPISIVAKTGNAKKSLNLTVREFDAELMIGANSREETFTLYLAEDTLTTNNIKVIDNKIYTLIPVKIKENKKTENLKLKDLKDYDITVNDMDVSKKLSVIGFTENQEVAESDDTKVSYIGLAVENKDIIDDLHTYGLDVLYKKDDKVVKESTLKIYVCEVSKLEPVIYNENLTLADVSLTEGWEWLDQTTKLNATDKNGIKYPAIHTDNNGNKVTAYLPVYVNKANPLYSVPTNLTATYGQTLASVNLPEGFSWQDDTSTKVGETGINSFKVKYTPSDIQNYNEVENISVNIRVDKKTLMVTTPSKIKTYDGTELTYSEGALITGFVGNEDATIKTTGTITDAGTVDNTYTITWKTNNPDKVDAQESNYTVNATLGKLTVNPVADKVIITIKGNDDIVTYNGEEQKTTGYTVISNNNLYNSAYIDFNGNKEATGVDAGTYNMGLKPSDFTNNSSNFANVEFVIEDGILLINKRNVTLTSDSKSKTYDNTAVTSDAVTVSGDGFVNDEGIDIYNVTGTQINKGSSKNTFTYTLKANTKENNYNITKVEGNLTIKPVEDKVTVTIAENNSEVTYNGSEQSLTGYTVKSISNGLYNSSNINFNGNATITGKNVGTYNMSLTPSDFANNSSNFTNVVFKIEDGSLNIKHKVVKVKANNISRYVNDSDPTLTATVSGTIGSDVVSYSLARSAGNETKTYVITASGDEVQGNYKVTYETGKFTIYNKIEYNLDGGGFVTPAKTTYTKEDVYTLPVPNKSGYVFLGWYGSNGSKHQTKVTLNKETGDKTYNAMWAKALSGALRTYSASDSTVSYSYDATTKNYSITQKKGSSGWGQGVICDGAKTAIPWGYTYILQLSIYVPRQSLLSLDTNAMFSDETGNDIYGDSEFYTDGVAGGTTGNIIQSGKWVTATLYMTNNNETQNPEHKTIYSYSAFGFNLNGASADLSYKVKDLIVTAIDLRNL